MNNELFKYPNVVGHGIGYKVKNGERTDLKVRVVMVTKKLPPFALTPNDLIPMSIDGLATDVIQVGHIIAHAPDRTGYFRPAYGGVSIGHYKITAGTLGVVVKINESKAILSNNHVMANCNDAQLDDPILQPGPYDGGTEEIAYLFDFEPLNFGTAPSVCPFADRLVQALNFTSRLVRSSHRVKASFENQDAVNIMDAAVAFPYAQDDLSETVLGLGIIQGVADPELGLEVTKSGRTTEVTTGTVVVINTTVTVDYGSGRSAMFEGQIVTSGMSQPGDSGSLLVTLGASAVGENLKAVGLLFGGSDQVTIHSPIQPILDRFGAVI